MNVSSLFSAAPYIAKDYNGNDLLTDKRMTLFSWWFENETAKARTADAFTYTLTPESLSIKGIEKFSVEEFIQKKTILKEKEAFFESAGKTALENRSSIPIKDLIQKFFEDLETLERLAKKGINLCQKAMENRLKVQEILGELSKIDGEILTSSCKDAASLVFPTQRQLQKLAENLSSDKQTFQLQYSNLIYSELLKSVRNLQKYS